jgi:hypothetical protein
LQIVGSYEVHDDRNTGTMSAARKPIHLARYAKYVIILLLLGNFSAYSDIGNYQCYAVAFWQGWLGLQKLAPPGQCAFMVDRYKTQDLISQDEILHAMQQWRLPSGLIQFVAAQSPNQPYHTLPLEYPALTLLVFSLALIGGTGLWYQVAFAIWMLVFVGCIYCVLQYWQSRQAALAFLLYLVLGGWLTALARYDIVPAALTLFALISAVQKHWNWAFALLALATLLKFYPIALLIPIFLALQRETPGKWYGQRRWLPLGVFVGLCVLPLTLSLFLSVRGTLVPLWFFSNRPVEIESLSSSILWILSLLGKTSLTYVYTFGSWNVLSSLSSSVTFLMTMLAVAGLLYTWWLQWQKQIDLALACLLTILIVIATGKVESAQYLIWAIPLAAYVGQGNRWWLLSGTVVGLLTTLSYLYLHFIAQTIDGIALFYFLSVGRNFLLFILISFLLIARSHSVRLPSLPLRAP